MKAIVLPRIAPIEEGPLIETELPIPVPKDDEILVRVSVCGLCHTDLDEIEGRLPPSMLPIVLGHQVVGMVAGKGRAVSTHELGSRVGIAWLYSSCGVCPFCRTGRENLCDRARWTGKDVNGGYAEYMVVHEDYAYPIPLGFSDLQAAPLLCAGVIGYRAIRLSNISDGQTVGLFGFGASAHIAIQLLRHQFPASDVFVFTRGDQHKELARRLGAAWTGSPGDEPPTALDRAIDFTPVGETIRQALSVLSKGGRVVVNAIRKTTAVPELVYDQHLWDEKELKSVANVTRTDAREFLPLAADIPLRPAVEEVALRNINETLRLLKQGKVTGAAALRFCTEPTQ
jgi:propanol-preferring alcohol dehydrogenase